MLYIYSFGSPSKDCISNKVLPILGLDVIKSGLNPSASVQSMYEPKSVINLLSKLLIDDLVDG